MRRTVFTIRIEPMCWTTEADWEIVNAMYTVHCTWNIIGIFGEQKFSDNEHFEVLYFVALYVYSEATCGSSEWYH